MYYFSFTTIISCILTYAYCSPYGCLEERISLMELKQFHDSISFREDIKALFNKVNNSSYNASAANSVDSGDKGLTKDYVKKLEDTITVVRRSLREKKQYLRNVLNDMNDKCAEQEENCKSNLISMKSGLEDRFSKITENDIQVKSHIDNTVSLLGKLSNQQEQAQTVNENILKQMNIFSETFDKVSMSMSHLDGHIRTLRQQAFCGTWTHFNTSCYFVGNDSSSFDEASNKCETLNAYLVEIESEDENTFLSGIAKEGTMGVPDHGTWVGGTDKWNDGMWTWYKSQTPFTFTAWKNNEPNGDTIENCHHLYRSHDWMWNDARCELTMSYICEKEIKL